MLEKGASNCLKIAVPPEGKSSEKIAQELDIPLEKIEAVFRNGRVQNIQAPVFPGDRVAFIPYGTPGPYRVLLGIRQPDPNKNE
jgi:hypothetical protein